MSSFTEWVFVILFCYGVYKLISWIAKKKEGLTSVTTRASKDETTHTLEVEPKLIEPLTVFDSVTYKKVLSTPPARVPNINNSFWTTGENHKALSDYFQSLNIYSYDIETTANKAAKAFKIRHAQVIDQQKQLLLRIYAAQKYIVSFTEELSSIDLSIKQLPPHLEIKVQSSPKLLTPSEVSKKYRLIPSQASGVAGKYIVQNGKVNSSNLAVAVMILAGSILHGQSNVSKMKRAAEEEYGILYNYSLKLKTWLDELILLDNSHNVETSHSLKQAETYLIELVEKVKAISEQGKDSLEQLTAEEKECVTNLYLLLLQANRLTQKNIVN